MFTRALKGLYGIVVDQRTGSGWRLPQLDGLRGIAAMMVLISHVWSRTPGIEYSWPYAAVDRGGAGGVLLFFALSGFLLYLPWRRSELEGRPTPSLRDYALRRCLRIMPAYYVSVVALAVLRVVVGGQEPISAQAMALHFLFLPTLGAPLQTVYWTLQTEEFFYWVLPLLHRVIATWGPRLMWLGACVIAAAWTWIGIRWLSGRTLQHWLEQTPLFLPAFGLGIWTAVVWSRDRTAPGAGRYVWLGAFAYFALAPLAAYVSRQTHHVLTPITMVALAPAASLLVLGAARGGAPLLAHPVLRFLGGISFSIYLWHFVVIRVVPVPAPISEMFWTRVLYTTAITVPAATVSFLFVERPFLKLRPGART